MMKFKFPRRVFPALGLILLISGLIASVIAVLRSTELRRRATETENRLVAEWKFDEGAGGTVADSSGNGNNGTWNGTGSHWVDGKSGKAGSFNGTDDYAVVKNDTTLDFPGTKPFSFTAWVKPGVDAAGGTILGKFNGGVEGQYILYLENGKLGFHREVPPYGQLGTTVMTADQWYHAAAVYDGVNKTIYVNGLAEESQASGSIPASTVDVTIGARYTSSVTTNFFKGNIDQVRIYNYALTPEQVVADMEQTSPTPTPTAVPTETPSPTPTPTPPGPITCRDGFSDNFDGAGLDTAKWEIATNNNGTVVQSQNQVVMTNPATDGEKFTRFNLKNKISGDFAAELDMKSLATAGNQRNGSVELSLTNYETGGFLRISRYADGFLQSFSKLSDQASINGSAAAIPSANPVKVKIERKGATARTYYDTGDGQGYKLHTTFQNAFSGEGTLEIFVLGFENFPEVTATVDNFSLRCAPPTGNLNGDGDVDIFDYNLLLEQFGWKGGPENGLVGYWPFDEGIGTIVADTSGNGKHGGWIGTGNHWVDGKFKKAGNFGGVDNRVEIPQFSPDTFSAMTISLWTNPDNQTVGDYAEHKDLIRSCANGGWWGISTNGDFNSSGKLNFNIGWLLGRDDWWNPPEAVIAKNTWNQLILVIDRISGRTAFYKNGLLISENVHTVGELHQSTGFNIGWDCAGPFSGIFDDIRIYNRVLSNQEIRELYEGQPADIDTDGDVDIFDYNVLLEHFGEHS